MDLWSYLLISVGVLNAWTCVSCLDTSQTASFHGGHFNVSLHSSSSSLTVELLFKTALNTGIILVTTSTDSPSDYLAVASNHSQIQVILHQGSSLNTLSLEEATPTQTGWHRLSLSLNGTVLELSVDGNILFHTLQTEMSYTSIHLGGPDSFLSSQLSDLPFHDYFIGCMTNVTINNNDVTFDYAQQRGVQSGCCIAARPLLYCFEDYLSNLSFRTSPVLTTNNEQLLVSFQIRAHRNGHVFSIDSESTTLTAVLSNTTLTLDLISSSQSVTSIDCPGNVVEREWHTVLLTFEPSTLSCDIDGARSSVTLQPSISSLRLSQLTFGRPNYIPEGLTTFGGCVRRLQINKADLSPDLASSTNLEEVINYDLVRWREIQFVLNRLEVMEGESVQVTDDIIQITLPADIYSDQFASRYEREIQQAIQLRAVDGPSEGYFARGDSKFRMSDFTYYDIISLNREKQIMYRHGGSINMTDTATLEAFVECDGEKDILFEDSLLIEVDSRNDIPVVSRRQRMDIAMGTSRVITPDIITVSDEETKDLDHILYSVVGMSSPPCGTCEGEKIGAVVRTHSPHLGALLFSQAAINSGNISFQHYPLFRTAKVTINLRVSDDLAGSIDTSIEVIPYEGHITLLAEENRCIFVKEGGFAVLDSTDLNASTDFEDQHPILTYDVIQGVRYGALQKWVSYPGGVRAQWITLERNGTFRNGVTLPHSFTQDDINNGRIRYVHYNSSQLFLSYDMFAYQLRSTNLLGPTGNFCIDVVFNDLLLTPDISIEIHPIVVNEGGHVTIDDQTLVTAIDVEAAYILDPIDTEQLDIVYFLVSPPSVGVLKLNNQLLKSGDNFTEGDVRARYLEYVHSGTEEHVDSFIIFARAVITDDLLLKSPNVTSEVTAHITVTPINNHLPSLREGLEAIQPAEGGWVTITTSHIDITDEDRPGDPLDILLRKPRSDTPEQEPNGHFAFSSNPRTPIRTFTMEQVENRSVIFVHNINESARLSFIQRLRIGDGDNKHYVRPSITIEALPLTLNVDLHLPDSECIAHLDAINDHPTFNLSHTHFTIMLTDHFGNNSNLVPNIKVNVSSPPSVGALYKTGHESVPVSQFRVSDIRHDLIEYRLGKQRNTSRDYFTLQFKYGHSEPVSVPLMVCIDPLPIPNHVEIEGVSVPYKGVVGIGPTNLWANNTRGSADSLVFHITRQPQYGVIFNQQSDELISLQNFTQADLNADRVAYEHINFAHDQEDSFEFRVCSEYGCSETHSFPISIFSVNLIIVNTGFSCPENLTHYITLEEMNIFAPPDFKNKKFRIKRRPNHGNISVDPFPSVQFFGIGDIETHSVYYKNDGRENLHDSFEFDATAKNVDTGKSLHILGFVNITIVPVNNHQPEVVNLTTGVTVARGGSLTLSTLWLSAHDFDSNVRDEDIVYRIQPSTPLFGYFYLDEDPGSSQHGIRNWTEGQLRSGRVSYRQNVIDEGNKLDLFFFSLFDGERSSATLYTIAIHIRGILFEQCGHGEASVLEGGHTNITINHLCFRASNDHSVTEEDFIYVITTLPEHGTLEFNSMLLGVRSNFSQAELRASHLLYTHGHSNEEQDAFMFEITVRTRTTDPEPHSFVIHINPIDDDPPHVTLIQDPAFVVELGELKLDNTVLEIIDRDSKSAKEIDSIVSRVIKPPSYGLLPRNRFGILTQNSLEFTKFDIDNDGFQYNHTTLGHTRDSFTFNITDGVNHQNDTYTVNIVILPNEILLRVHIITVLENGYVSLKEEYFLEVEHDYLRTINGRIIIQSGGEPQYGVFRRNSSDCSSAGETITHFTTDEMAAGAIIYCHGGSEHSNDSFRFVYASIGPTGYDRMSNVYSVRIEVTPHNDQPPSLWRHRELSLEPWTRDTVLLDTQYFNATDGDTPDDGLFYTFIVHNDGFIAFVDAPLTHIQTFTQQDVNEERVLYAHQFDREGYISFTVSDGTFTAHGNITISARDLSLLCEREKWNLLEVPFKGSITLNSSYLECTTNDDETIRLISYSVENLNHGFFQVDGEQRSKFNSSEINLGVVRYIHTDVDYWDPEDRITLTVSTPLADDVKLTLTIRICYPSSRLSPLAVNKGVELPEGERVCLSEDVLDARNLRYSTFMRMNGTVSLNNLVIMFEVTSLPAHGVIRYRDHVMSDTPTFTQDDVIAGVVCYHHDGTENYLDSIPFTLIIANQSMMIAPIHQSVSISVLPVNDERPFLVTPHLNLTLVLGFNIVLSQQILEVRDDDTQPSNIDYTLTSLPSNAHLIREGRNLSINGDFSQDDINQGLLELRPRFLGASSFQFSVSDEDTTLEYQFSVVVEQHMLKVKDPGVIKFEQNQHIAPITTDLLDTSTNGLRDETRFVITRQPSDGMIKVDQTSVSEFSQVDVDIGRVSYIPDASSQQYKDSFTVKVKNRGEIITNVVIRTTALVLGQVKERTGLNFGASNVSDISLPLPANVLSLSQLQIEAGSLPLVEVIGGPTYGHLEKRFILNPRDRSARQDDNDNRFTFRYNELKNGWIFYTWDSVDVIDSQTVTDSITVLVFANGMKPGEAVINLEVTPPVGITPPPPLTPSLSSTDRSDTPSPRTGMDDGFTMYVLIPIIGIILILILVIIVVVLFCLTQQNNIKKKLQPNVGSSTRNHTHYPIPLMTAPRPTFSPRYDFDPSGPGSAAMDSDNEDHNSETSSGFSESITPQQSPTHSPHIYTHVSIPQTSSHSHLSPTYTNPPVRSRIRSNVSITYTSRNSVTSDLSVDDSPEFYSHSLPRPHFQLSMPVPVRPASHAAFREGHRGIPNVESGYGSVNIRDNSSDDVVMTTTIKSTVDNGEFESNDTPVTHSKVGVSSSDHMTFPTALEDDDSSLPEFCNPELYRVTNIGPVLKKEEYWV